MGILEMIAQGSAPDILGNVQKGVGIGRDVMAMRAYQQEQEQAANSQKAWGAGMNNLKAAATGGGDIMPPLMELYAQDAGKAKLIQDAIMSADQDRAKQYAQSMAMALPLSTENEEKAKEIIAKAKSRLNPNQDIFFYSGADQLLSKTGPAFQEGMFKAVNALSQFGYLKVETSLEDQAKKFEREERETSTKEKNATTAAQRAEDAKKIAFANMEVAKQNNIRSVNARREANEIAKTELEWKQRDAQRQAEEGKIPKGYRRTADGGGLEPIPGGPEDIKAKEIKTQKASAYKNLLSQYENISANIDTLVGNDQQKGLIDDSTTGREGRLWSMTGDPDVEDVDSYLEMIQSNTMFDSLFELKKSGISLGNLNMNEVMSLKSKVAALNRKGHKGTLKKQLGVIKKEYERLLKNASSGLDISFDGEGNIIE